MIKRFNFKCEFQIIGEVAEKENNQLSASDWNPSAYACLIQVRTHLFVVNISCRGLLIDLNIGKF